MTSDCLKVAGGGSSFAQAFQLCSEVAVVVWDIPPQLPALGKFTLAMQSQPVPLVSMTLPRADGGQCVLWATKPGSEAEDAQIAAADGSTLQTFALQPTARLPLLDVEALLGNLSPEGRVKFLNNLLTVWRSAFRLSRDELFSSVVEDAVFTLVPAPRLANSVCQIAPGRYLVETDMSPELGEIRGIYAIGASSVLRAAVAICRRQQFGAGLAVLPFHSRLAAACPAASHHVPGQKGHRGPEPAELQSALPRSSEMVG